MHRAVSDTHKHTVSWINSWIQAGAGSKSTRASFVSFLVFEESLHVRLSHAHTHVHTHACTRTRTRTHQWALIPLDRALAAITVMISPESGTWNGDGEPRPFIKLIMNRLWEAAAEMLAAGFLAFWLQGLDPAGRSSVGKNKLIRPGMWLCFESVLCSLGTFAVSAKWWEVTRPWAGDPSAVCWGCHTGEGNSLGRTGIWVVLLERVGCQHRLAAQTRRNPPPSEPKLALVVFP